MRLRSAASPNPGTTFSRGLVGGGFEVHLGHFARIKGDDRPADARKSVVDVYSHKNVQW